MQNGADPNLPNYKGETPLQIISTKQNILIADPEVTAKIIKMSDET